MPCEVHTAGNTCPIGCEYILRNTTMKVPHWAICPITHEIFRQPVIDTFGHTYESSAFVQWLHVKPDTSPINLKYAFGSKYFRNYRLLDAITELWRLMIMDVYNQEFENVCPNAPKRKRVKATPNKPN